MLPVPVIAHPHVYIDTNLDLLYNDQGELTGFGVEWSYDELYSLLIIEDLSLDQDGNGKLTPEENKMIQGFDADWDADFDGRLYPFSNGQPLELEPVRDFTAEYRDGRLISYHLHPLSEPLAAEKLLTVQVYDPEFYVDFSLPEPPRTKGREDCEVKLAPGDPNAAPDAYRAAVEELLGSDVSDDEANLVTVDIGAAGADEAQIRCGMDPSE